jgi:hypothetical protein
MKVEDTELMSISVPALLRQFELFSVLEDWKLRKKSRQHFQVREL